MAIHHICGFELGSGVESRDGAIIGTGSVQSSIKKSGNYALRINPTGADIGYFALSQYSPTSSNNLTTALADYRVRFAFRVDTAPTSGSEQILSTLNTTDALRINSDRTISFYRGTTLVATSTTALTLNAWYILEFHRTGTTQEYELKINTATEFSGTHTNNATNINGIRLGKATNRNSQSIDVYYDDYMFMDYNDSWPNQSTQILVLNPSSVGDDDDFLLGAGANKVVAVSSPHNDDTSYIYSSTIDHAQNFFLDNNLGNGTINFLLPFLVHRDDNTTQVVRLLMYSGSNGTSLKQSTQQSTPPASGANYYLRAFPLQVDPADNQTWDSNRIAVLQVGIIRNGVSGMTAYLSTLGAMVAFVPSPGAETYTGYTQLNINKYLIGSAANQAPIYSGSSSLVTQQSIIFSDGYRDRYFGYSHVTLGGTSLNSSVEFFPPIYEGISNLSTETPFLFSAGESSLPVYAGQSSLVTGNFYIESITTNILPIYDGTASLLNNFELDSLAEFYLPLYSGHADLSTGNFELDVEAAFTIPVYAGSSSLLVDKYMYAPGIFSRPIYTGQFFGTIDADLESEASFFVLVTFYVGSAVLSTGNSFIVKMPSNVEVLRNFYFDDDLIDNITGQAATKHGDPVLSDNYAPNAFTSGGSLQFDGVDDYLSFSPVVDISRPFSISCWFYPQSDIVATSHIIGWNMAATPLMRISSSRLVFVKSSGAGDLNINVTGVLQNQWNFGVISYDGSQAIVYLNGNYSSKITSGNIFGNVDGVTMKIGENFGQFFGGYIDDLRIYQTALSITNMNTLYSGSDLVGAHGNFMSIYVGMSNLVSKKATVDIKNFVRIIDDSHSSQVESFLTWDVSANNGYNGTKYRFFSPGLGAASAWWQWNHDDLIPYRYDVYATWVSNNNRPTNAKYEIIVPGQATKTVFINQRVNPIGPTHGGVQFQKLATLDAPASSVRVRIYGHDTGYAIADATMLTRTNHFFLPTYSGHSYLSRYTTISTSGITVRPYYTATSRLSSGYTALGVESVLYLPVYTGDSALLSSTNMFSEGITLRPTYHGMGVFDVLYELQAQGVMIRPVYEAISNLQINRVEYVFSAEFGMPYYSGISNLEVMPVLVANGVNIVEGFIYRSVLYVTGNVIGTRYLNDSMKAVRYVYIGE